LTRLGAIAPETLRHVLRRPATVLYPFERLALPKDFRGRPQLDTNKCTGCGLCARDCPAEAIEMVELAPKVKRPGFYYDRCAFCSQCAESCPRGAITMTEEFELAAYDRPTLYRAPEMPDKLPEPKTGKDEGGAEG